MKLKLNTDKLKEIMISFYTLTGIRPVIFDDKYNEIFSYPQEKCQFCNTIRSDKILNEKCMASDAQAFKSCSSKNNIVIYKCHAGLVEACAPIKSEKKIIGYIMFGQITDIKDKEKLNDVIHNTLKSCTADGIKYKSKKQILAASKLLEICTDYILLKEMIETENDKITTSAKEYISEHLGDDITICDLCNAANTNRTKLYETFKKECNMGIAFYIKKCRLEKAKQLLKTTDMSISEISNRIGFTNYNYFSRIFKQCYNISPKHMR